MSYLIRVSQGVAHFHLDLSHQDKGKAALLEENSQPGPAPFLKKW